MSFGIVSFICSQLVASERHGYGGLVVGPAATGKSHSVKELSRLFGRFFVAFNCSAEISTKQIIALIKGSFQNSPLSFISIFHECRCIFVQTVIMNHY
uniref:Dynein heavy chain hydrolytic ATP-binding dynein motor region domain-containing protein n=1 Tax=Parascaris equorum TaxID=6256 RepID=A0A914RTK5_PAREQ